MLFLFMKVEECLNSDVKRRARGWMKNADVAQPDFTKLSETLYLNLNREIQNYAELLFYGFKDLLKFF